ncbi:TrbI/VirB10 family protein [Pasteurella multocida]|uniref:TrbI/VirB10 family protein n=1 Tax=Pasteurella multocida TaxID=747 RepID=UPI002FE150FC
MSENINQQTKKNQNTLFLVILLCTVIAVIGVWGANKFLKEKNIKNKPKFEEEIVLEPSLTGAVVNTFDGKVGSQVFTDVQVENKETRQLMQNITEKLDRLEKKLVEKDKENEELRKRLSEAEKVQEELTNQVGNLYPTDTPSEEFAPTPDINRNRINYSQPNENYIGNSGVITLTDPPKKDWGFERKTYTPKKTTKKESENKRFYVPSGAFSNAIILEGADASAAVTAQETDSVPMQFKLTGKLHLPSNQKLNKLNGCFVTAGTYGDISSERAIVRLKRLSCIINGKHIDQEVQGHVAFYGKNGIKGIPVMRNGKILGLAFASGALGGLGSGISQVGSTTVGIGATHTIGASEVLRQSLGNGTQTAANKLADYYIQRAEQYHPVIPIGSANRVEVIFQEGFWAEFIENDNDVVKVEERTVNNEIQNKSKQKEGYMPPELMKQLGEVTQQKLSDFVTPNQK